MLSAVGVLLVLPCNHEKFKMAEVWLLRSYLLFSSQGLVVAADLLVYNRSHVIQLRNKEDAWNITVLFIN